MQVEGQHGTSVLMATGARVSNAYTTYLILRDSPGKLGLIPHSLARVKLRWYKMGVRLIS
jgi:hypothetical protein